MNIFNNVKQHRFAIVGFGKTGKSFLRYLKFLDAEIICICDTRELLNIEHIDIPLICGELNIDSFIGVTVVLVSPTVPFSHPVLNALRVDGVKVLGELEVFASAIKYADYKLIGITGSNGKTTTTTLTNYLLNKIGISSNLGGNIGVPLLDLYFLVHKQSTQVLVLELSNLQLAQQYSLPLDVAVILNISEDHLDIHNSLLEYAYIKSSIFHSTKVQIINYDDIFISAMVNTKSRVFTFSMFNNKCDAYIEQNDIIIQGEFICNCKDFQLYGQHNQCNLLVAITLIYNLGVLINKEKLHIAIKSFSPLKHRMQLVCECGGISFINDSKATNTGAVLSALASITGKIHLILGGLTKGQDFTVLISALQRNCHSIAIIGEDKDYIYELCITNLVNIDILCCLTMKDAVELCYTKASSGDTVLLSPACSSFDMFDNYEHRGDIFTSLAINITNFHKRKKYNGNTN